MSSDKQPKRHQSRKRFGQHFLHDKAIIGKIVDAIAPQDGIPIVEIGPGAGALTVPLLERAGTLDVIEIDRDLAGLLAEKCRGVDGLRIYTEDALKVDFRQRYRGKIMLAGNLPYNISTPLLFHILDQIDCIHTMIFMMQKEIVDRICTQPGQPNYGRLSVMVQSKCHTEKLMTIGPGAFTPEPRVKSSLLRLVPREDFQAGIRDAGLFSDIVRIAFSHRRKTIRNALKDFLADGEFAQLGLAPVSRPETFSVTDFIDISNYIHDRGASRPSVDKPVDDNSH